jgi:hypothetical protein
LVQDDSQTGVEEEQSSDFLNELSSSFEDIDHRDLLGGALALTAVAGGAVVARNHLSPTDVRERMANQLVMRGHASMDEILQASFGEWPPKGLEIVGQNDQRVNLVNLLDMHKADPEKSAVRNFLDKATEKMGVAGRATLGGERTIGINRTLTTAIPGLLGKPDLNTTLGHEGAHILQGDHYWRAEEIFGRSNAQEIWGSQRNASANEIAGPIFDQHEDNSMVKRALRKTPLIGQYSGYLKEGIEIQARIHELLISGYPRWGRLPGNREELFVALENVGAKLPKEISDSLDQSPTIEETRKVFSGKRSSSGTSMDINSTQRELTKSGRVEFWEKGITGMYADLIEMYGDKEGRARFSLGANPRYQYRKEAQKSAKVVAEERIVEQEKQTPEEKPRPQHDPVDRYVHMHQELAEARYNLEHTYEQSRANPFTFDEEAVRTRATAIMEREGKGVLQQENNDVRREIQALERFKERYTTFAENTGLIHKNDRGAVVAVPEDLDKQILQDFDALIAEGEFERVNTVGRALGSKEVSSYLVARENLLLLRQEVQTDDVSARSPGLPDNFTQTVADEVKEKIKTGGVESLKQSTQEMNAERRALSHYEGDLDRLSNKIADETGNKPEYRSGPEKLERFDALMAEGGVDSVKEEQQRLRVGKQVIRDYVTARDDNAGTKVAIEDGGVSYGTKDGLREPMVSPGTVDNIILRNELTGLLETDNPAVSIAEETARLKQETDQLIRAHEAQSIAERNAAEVSQTPPDGPDHSDATTQTAELQATEQTVAEGNPVADRETAPDTDVSQTAETGQTPDGASPDATTQTTDVAGTEPDVETAKIPDDPETVKAPEVTSTRMSAWGQSGGSAAGLAMGTVGLTNAIQSGDTTGMIVSGADVAVSGGDLALDAASAAGRTVSDALRGVASKANIAVMIADGAYQISREEGLENKVARGAAVAGTTGTAFAVGGTAATIGATGAAATAATVAAPVVAAVAVGMTADAAVDAYKVTEELEDSIRKNEQGVKVRDNVEQSGAPSLSNYRNLRVYAATEAGSPDGEEGLSRREISQKVREHEYSQDPVALDRLEEGLRAKVAEYDKVIEENDSMIHDSVRFFWASDEIDTQRMAKIDRAPYVAALNELEMYREELKSYEQEQAQAVEQKSESEQTAEQREPEPIQLTQTFLDKVGSSDAVPDQPELEQADVLNDRSTPGIENDVSDLIARIDSPAENQSPEIAEHKAVPREETPQVQSPDAGQDAEQLVTNGANGSEVLETDEPALSIEVAPDEPDTPKDASVEAEPEREAVTERPQISENVVQIPDHSESLGSVQSDATPVEPTDKPGLAEEPAESHPSTIVDESAPVVAEREKETAPPVTDHSRMAIQGEGRGVEQFDSQVKELQEALIQADPKYKEILTYTNRNGEEVTADALEGWRTRKATDLYAQENNMSDPRQIPIDDFINAVKNKAELTAEAATTQSISVDPKSFSGADATYSGDTALAAEAAEVGVEFDPELLQPGQMPVTGPVTAPQTLRV